MAGRAGEQIVVQGLNDDPELVALDDRLIEIERWIERAADGLLCFKAAASFRRNSASSSRDSGSTSTARSFYALHEYRRYLVEEGRRDELAARVDSALKDLIRGWAMKARTSAGLGEIRSFGEHRHPNLFTDSHLLTSLALTKNLASELNVGKYREAAGEVRAQCRKLNLSLLKHMADQGELGARTGEPGHHFITFHAVRAVDVFGGMDGGLKAEHRRRLGSVAENRALQQLAYHSAQVMARFDPARLAFAAALLRRLRVADWRQLSEYSIEVVVGAQTDDGAWPTSQLVAYQSRSMLHVSSYELGLALACMTLRELSYGETGLARTVLPSLDRVMALVRAGYVANQDHGLNGWGNDRTRWEGLVESWATAIVLTLLLRFRDVVLEFRQELVLRRYNASRPERLSTPWPDLAGALFPERELDRSALDNYSDPTARRILVRSLRQEVLEPVVTKRGQRPEKASLIFYGSPGTRKTSLVRAAAGALRWPLLTLSPPDFLGEGGLEGFEVSAARIFEDLMRLRRAVILFDECEDFFKPRPVESDEEEGHADERRRDDAGARTIGAFLTAGMLPRLQALRDRRWVIFVLATNSKLSALDEAVRRPGRFDFAECLEHPVLEAQKRYVENHRRRMSTKQREQLCLALDDLATRGKDRIPFAVIDYVVNTIRDRRMPGTREEVARLLTDRLNRIDEPPSLTQPI